MAERTEDLNLPMSVVTRLIKDALPAGVNVSKEARVAMARAASVFVLYATATANNYALKSKRRTLAATDVVEAMKDMEMEQFIEPLKAALATYRQQQPAKQKRTSKGQLVHQQEQEDDEVEFIEPPAKKAAISNDEYADAAGDEDEFEFEDEEEPNDDDQGGGATGGEQFDDEAGEEHDDDGEFPHEDEAEGEFDEIE